MTRCLSLLMLSLALTGCVHPQAKERPMPNGAWLVIEHDQAWAVLVSEGRRVEEKGRVLKVLRADGAAPAAASYVIETAHCGRLQWLADEDSDGAGRIRLLPEDFNPELGNAECRIAAGQERLWTALDYSG